MKKLRGLRRYFRKLERHNDLEKLRALTFETESWFDFWHAHYDWQGLGNSSWKRRKPHLDTLFRNFNLYPDQLKNIKKPFQLFIHLNDFDSSDDAVFIHTQNPNGSKFPYKTDLTDKCTLTNEKLISYINQKEGFVKLFGASEKEGYCILYRSGLGVELK